MLKVLDTLYLSNSAISIAPYGKKLLLVDAGYNEYIYSMTNKKFIKTKQLSSTKPLHSYSKAIASNNDGLFTIVLNDDKKLMLLKEDDRTTHIKTFNYHLAKIDVTAFFDNTLLASGGEDGRVFLYDLNHQQLLAQVLVRPEFITCVRFSTDGKFLFCASYENKGFLYSLQRSKLIKTIQTDSIIEDACFIDSKLFFVEREGKSYVYDLKKRQVISKIKNTLMGWSTSIEPLDETFVLVATRSNFLYIFDVHTNSIAFKVDLEVKGLTTIKIIENNILVVGFINGQVKIIDMLYGLDEFNLAMKLKDFLKANTLISQNQFLMISDEMRKFNKNWSSVFDKAKMLILANRIDDAKEMVKPFMQDAKNEIEFNIYIENRTEITNFLKLIEKKDYPNALKKAEANKYLMNLPTYQKINEHFESMFNKAKSLLEANKANKLQALKLLQPYAQIDSKKTIISNLFNNIDVFEKGENLIKKREFVKYFMLVKEYRFLETTQLYQKAIMLLNRVYDDLIQAFEDNDFEKFDKLANDLAPLAPFSENVATYKEYAKIKKEFFASIDTDSKTTFELLSQYTFLQQTQEYTDVINKFEEKCKEAKELAYNGDVTGVLEVLRDYLHNDFTIHKVAEILKIAYLKEWENNYQVEEEAGVDLKEAVNLYLQRYGKDVMLSNTLVKTNKYDLVKDIEDYQPVGYKKLGFMTSIFEI